MNSLLIKMSKTLLGLIVLISSGAVFAQESQQKTVKEVFQVNKDVVIDLDASYTDIEFDTWNKNRVEVEATLEVDDVSKEEAEFYFKNWDFEALGNSSKVSVTSKHNTNNHWISGHDFEVDIEPIEFEIAEPIIIEPSINEEIVIMTKELERLPPLPPLEYSKLKVLEFDYDKYKKEGDKYLAKWKKEWGKAYDGDMKKSMEAWKKEMEAWKKEMKDHQRTIVVEKKRVLEEQRKLKRELHEQRREQLHLKREKVRQKVEEARERARAIQSNKTLYYSHRSKNKKHNVKRKIKIKMPKGATLKLNVRHGELKLSDNAGINANLSHTKLYANTITGKNTTIRASYSPVIVENWNRGNLNVKYNKDVVLKNVEVIELQSNSSNVTINQLLNTALIHGNFGKLEINGLDNAFKHLNIALDNTNATIALPNVDYNLQYSGVYSKLSHPDNKKGNNNTFIIKDAPNGSPIIINANYSNVMFK